MPSSCRYLGSIGAQRRQQEAAALEAKAEAMLADVARLSGTSKGGGSSSGGGGGSSIEQLLAR